MFGVRASPCDLRDRLSTSRDTESTASLLRAEEPVLEKQIRIQTGELSLLITFRLKLLICKTVGQDDFSVPLKAVLVSVMLTLIINRMPRMETWCSPNQPLYFPNRMQSSRMNVVGSGHPSVPESCDLSNQLCL